MTRDYHVQVRLTKEEDDELTFVAQEIDPDSSSLSRTIRLLIREKAEAIRNGN